MADTSLEPRNDLGQLQAPGSLPVPSQSLQSRPQRGAGGTPGGAGTFLIGFVLACAGGYLVLEQVTVSGGWGFSFFGMHGGFGLVMLPFLTGLVGLAMDAKSKLAWLLMIGGGTIIGASILMNMSIYFRPTSLFATLVMFGMLAGGVGLILRSLRAYPESPAP